jgi:hypothetical protein
MGGAVGVAAASERRALGEFSLDVEPREPLELGPPECAAAIRRLVGLYGG